MKVGVPAEVKPDEYRVGIMPSGVDALCQRGHQVLVQAGAGAGSGYVDDEYAAAGATIFGTAAEIFAAANLIVKVKEPQPQETPLIRAGQIVFTYLHLAASESLTRALLASGATCLAYETLADSQNRLPLLTPMSEVAGRMSVQQGAKYLEKPQGGRGVLLGGVPGVAPAHVTILGAGVVGTQAAVIAAGFRATVHVLDINLDRLRVLDDLLPANVNVLFSDRLTILDELTKADLVIGSVLVPGARAPQLVRREDLAKMKPGSVIVDVAIDQGGCIETSHPTTHREPTFVVDGVVHYCVANMPGAVGRTSTAALANATIPWIVRLADGGIDLITSDRSLQSATNLHNGKIMHPAVAATFPGLPAGRF